MLFLRLGPVLAVFAALVPASVQAQSLKLIPMPREVHAVADQPLSSGVRILCPSCDAEDQFAADDLAGTLRERALSAISGAGFKIDLTRLASHPVAGFSAEMKPEGYVITASSNTLTVTGATAEGVFYGAQTVKQLIEGSGSRAVLHAANIRDWPALKYRGLDDDLSRGPVPTLDFQKKQMRVLAAYKVNIYSPYFEHTLLYPSNPLTAPPGGAMTPDQVRELVAYAARYHIDVIPEQEAFGHLHHLLKYELYSPLGETPHGHVLAPGQAGSLPLIRQLFA